MKKLISKFMDGILFMFNITAAMVAALLFVHFVAQFVFVSGSSMAPMLQNKDCLLVSKLDYKFGDPKRFDVVVFEYDDKTYFIKRVIGLPGETIQIEYDGSILVNSEKIVEKYGKEVIVDPGITKEPITLKEDEYFVLGDNRNHSTDSRSEVVGPVNKSKIIGRAILRIFPFSGKNPLI